MKAIYTDAAKLELEAFQIRQQEMLEGLIAERKLVLGDEVLEITASDIKAAAERIQIYRPQFLRTQSAELVMRAYVVIGIAMMIGAFFYPQLLEIYSSNKTQAFIFAMGAAMAAMGWLFSHYLQSRRRRTLEDFQAYMAAKSRTTRELEVNKENADRQSEA